MFGRKKYAKDEWNNIDFWRRRVIVYNNQATLANLMYASKEMRKLFIKVYSQVEYYREQELVYEKFPKTYMELSNNTGYQEWTSYRAGVYCPDCNKSIWISKRKLKKLLDTIWSCTKCHQPYFIEQIKYDMSWHFGEKELRKYYQDQYKEWQEPKLIIKKTQPPETTVTTIKKLSEFVDKKIEKAMNEWHWPPITSEQKEALYHAAKKSVEDKATDEELYKG